MRGKGYQHWFNGGKTDDILIRFFFIFEAHVYQYLSGNSKEKASKQIFVAVQLH